MTPLRVSVVVPTLNEEHELPRVLDHLATLPGSWEVVVADGGSRDRTAALARQHPLGPRVVVHDGGRAAQCNAGAGATTGGVVLFLHADSRLPPGAHAALQDAHRAGAPGGNFALCFDGDDRFARALGAVYRRQRRHGYYYGDSCVWVSRAAWDALRGFRELAIMDDYDFVRRLERLGGTRCLPGPARTSARRWRAIGIPRTVLSWFVIRWLYLAGVPPARLHRLYHVVR